MNVRAMTGSSAAPPTTVRRSRPPRRARIGLATMLRSIGVASASSQPALPCSTRQPRATH